MSAFGPGQTVPPISPGPSPTLAFSGFWRRLVAYLIDGIILNVAIWIVAGALGGDLIYTDPDAFVQGTAIWSISAASFLIPMVYTIGFWISSGATPGKMVFGMRILQAETGYPITPGQAIGRFFGYFVSSFVLGLGFLWVGFDARKQGWHDKLAGTVVIRPRHSDVAQFRG